MAKQASPNIITGVIDNLVFYEMDGKGYVRRRSSLTRKQFKTKDCFEGSRKSASRFGTGNILAGEVYGNIPLQERNYSLFCLLRSKAIALLKQGVDPDATKLVLQKFINTAGSKDLRRKLSPPH